MSGIALAQENTTKTVSEEGNDTVVMQVDNQLTLVDYRFTEKHVMIILDSGYSRPVVLSDMYVTGSGAQQIPRKNIMLDAGKNRITFDATSWKGMRGVAISSSRGVVAITDSTGGGFSFPGTYSGGQVIAFLSIGSLIGIGLVVVISYKRKLDYTSEITREM